MRVSVDGQAEAEATQVTVTCIASSSALIAVEGSSPEDTYAGDQIVLRVDEVKDIADDNVVTITLHKQDGNFITRRINLTDLFDLVRDHVGEDGIFHDEGYSDEDDDEDESLNV